MRKTCFYIGPIGDEKSEMREWSDNILDYIVAPTVIDLGYDEPVRADKIPHGSSITFEIMRRLVQDDLVIADLTGGNPNVFYELAIRHVIKKPVVHLIRFGEKIPFDVKDIMVISVRVDNLSAAEKTRKSLRDVIRSMESDNTFVLPYIERIAELKNIFDSPRNEKEETLNLLKVLDEIRVDVSETKNQLIDFNSQLGNTKRQQYRQSPFVERRLEKFETSKTVKPRRKK